MATFEYKAVKFIHLIQTEIKYLLFFIVWIKYPIRWIVYSTIGVTSKACHSTDVINLCLHQFRCLFWAVYMLVVLEISNAFPFEHAVFMTWLKQVLFND